MPRRHSALGQLVGYLLVGGSGYVLAMGCYAAELELGVPPYPAIAVVFVLNGVWNFLLMRRYVFPASGRPVAGEARRFTTVALASLLVNYAAFALLYSGAGLSALLAQALAIIIATPVGFVLNRLWSFGPHPGPPR